MQRTAQLRALSMVVLAAGLGACASHHRNREAALQFQEEPVATLYNEGATYLDDKRWQDALHAFQEVER